MVCPNLRRGHLFHYNAFAGIGYIVVPTVFYFFKAVAQETRWQWRIGSEPEKENGVDLVTFFIKIVLFLLSEYVFRDAIPKAVWGTKDVGIYPDFLVRHLLYCVVGFWLLNSEWVQYFIEKLKGKRELDGGRKG